MGFLKKTWSDRVAEYINRRLLTKGDGSTEQVTVSRDEGEVSQTGDAFSAANMNDLEQRIDDAMPHSIVASLTAGQTSLTVADALLTDTALVDIYSKATLKSATSTTGSVTMEFKAYSTTTPVYLKVTEM